MTNKEGSMKIMRLVAMVLLFMCAVVYLADFFITGSRQFSELGAGVSCLLVCAVLVVSSRRAGKDSDQV